MTDYIQMTNQAEVDSFEAVINAKYGFPDGNGTDTFFFALSATDNKIYIPLTNLSEEDLSGKTIVSDPPITDFII